MAGILFIISAPSGSGKSTLVSELRKQVSGVDFAISWTTRAPRGSEENGREYNFTSRAEFQRMIDAGIFLEFAEVFGHFYGTARQSLEEARAGGHDLLLDIDVQGAEQLHRKLPEAVSIFILPPDRKTLELRLRKRSEDAEEVIQRRLVTASREIENYKKYTYILVNDRLEESIERLKAMVESERLRRKGGALSKDGRAAAALADRCRLANVGDRVRPILASFSAPVVSGGH